MLTIVIFGASGDLTQRKLLPALYSLHRKRKLPQETHIIGYARRPYSDEEFRRLMRQGAEQFNGAFSAPTWEEFAANIHYIRGDLDVVGDYARLGGEIGRMEGGSADRLYYLATGPELFIPIVEGLGQHGLNQGDGRRSIVIEKPFGADLESARALSRSVQRVFTEDQIYRIDHYLGKETAQNILFFRFANTIWEPIWSRNYIDNVQVTVAEQVDVSGRAGYYDKAGVLRDMFQNHLLQLLCLVAMEPPSSFRPDPLRNERYKVLSSIRPIDPAGTVVAQYDGYLNEDRVAAGSRTPTYAALRLFIDNWRWQGVPFYLRSGKALAGKNTEIIIEFKCPPLRLFDLPPSEHLTPNRLSLRIQPDEGIDLSFEAKVPDSRDTETVAMDFQYQSLLNGSALPDAYERLLLDAIQGDASLYIRDDSIELSWKLIDPIIRHWEDTNTGPLATYPKGARGPVAADVLLAGDGRRWNE